MRKIIWKKAIKKNRRLYCPICKTDITIIVTHEPCSMSFSEGDNIENVLWAKPFKINSELLKVK